MTPLEEYREQIDAIDKELVRLFLQRMEVTEKVGEYKKARGLPVLDAEREGQVLSAKAALTDDPARKEDVLALYACIMALSRRQQEKLMEGDGPAGGRKA